MNSVDDGCGYRKAGEMKTGASESSVSVTPSHAHGHGAQAMQPATSKAAPIPQAPSVPPCPPPPLLQAPVDQDSFHTEEPTSSTASVGSSATPVEGGTDVVGARPTKEQQYAAARARIFGEDAGKNGDESNSGRATRTTSGRIVATTRRADAEDMDFSRSPHGFGADLHSVGMVPSSVRYASEPTHRLPTKAYVVLEAHAKLQP